MSGVTEIKPFEMMARAESNCVGAGRNCHRFEGLVGFETRTLTLQHCGDILIERHRKREQEQVFTRLDAEFVVNCETRKAISTDTNLSGQAEDGRRAGGSRHARSFCSDFPTKPSSVSPRIFRNCAA